MLSDRGFLKWAAKHAVPIRNNDFQDLGDLAPFKALVGKARVVGFGESQHHVGEFARIRARVFKYLVEELGFTTFVFECGVIEAKAAHDYVLGLHNDFDAALLPIESGFNAWRGFQDLLQWMREYNLRETGARKLNFYGMDGSRRWMSTRTAVRYACDYLDKVNANRAARFRSELLPLADEISLANVGSVATGNVERLIRGLGDLVGHLELEQMQYVEQTGLDSFDWAHRASLIARQIGAILSATHDDPASAQRNRWGIRDAGMANEILWILGREGPDAKLFVHAANMHLQRTFATDQRATAGQHLALRMAPDELFIVAGTNYFSLKPNDPPIAGSLQASLGELNIPSFVIDMRTAEQDAEAGPWLKQELPDRSNIDFVPIRVSQAWDALYFTRTIALDTINLPPSLQRDNVDLTPDWLERLPGTYDINGIGDSHVVLRIYRDGDRLMTDGEVSDGELFPMHVTQLLAFSDTSFGWREWPHRIQFEFDAAGIATGLNIQAPGAFDKFHGVQRRA
ncbi:erythromycin esterase family protein [Mesorhizobium sp.]|uniref:erythromycin esterase family protein n=1 Tax=Mesorhizobium sp. TaxID=1871066 RepID=UPI0025EBDEFC|nr:erythromycin esterase family protein [Mesorhizobium sp.]